MEFKEFQNKDSKELQVLMREARATLLKLHLQQEARELKNVRSIRDTKKTIAQLATLLHTKSSI